MKRPDLLTITHNDIVALSNRGTLKRILKELEKDTLTWQIEEDDDTLTVHWSDDVTCIIGADDGLATAHCTCPSHRDICRHLLRTVLAYQEHADNEAADNTDEEDDTAPQSWNPGDWDESTLQQHFPPGEQRRAKRLRTGGLVMELTRALPPTARFHSLGHFVRFVVPGDPSAAVCDCGESNPCIHVLLAVWGYRELDTATDAGVVSTGRAAEPLATDLVDDAENVLADFAIHGVAGITPTFLNRLRGLRERLDDDGAVWLANIAADLIDQCEYYDDRNARFSARDVAELAGEFMLRLQVATTIDPPVPRYFLVGHRRRGKTRFGRASLVGLGSTARMRGASVEVLAFAQDTDTGNIVAITRTFDPPEDDVLPTLDELGARSYAGIPDLHTLASSRTVVKRARMLASHRLRLRRSGVGTYAQDFDWHRLHPPHFASYFRTLHHRLANRAPSALRPRRLDTDFAACPVAATDDIRFCKTTQSVRATLVDDEGHSVELRHPYTHFNAPGTERLLSFLIDPARRPRFVAGTAHRRGPKLLIEPTALIFTSTDGDDTTMVQPWLDPLPADGGSETAPDRPDTAKQRPDALDATVCTHRELLSELLLLGRDQATLRCHKPLQQLHRRYHNLDASTFTDGITAITDNLGLGTDPADYAHAVLHNARLLRLAADV